MSAHPQLRAVGLIDGVDGPCELLVRAEVAQQLEENGGVSPLPEGLHGGCRAFADYQTLSAPPPSRSDPSLGRDGGVAVESVLRELGEVPREHPHGATPVEGASGWDSARVPARPSDQEGACSRPPPLGVEAVASVLALYAHLYLTHPTISCVAQTFFRSTGTRPCRSGHRSA